MIVTNITGGTEKPLRIKLSKAITIGPGESADISDLLSSKTLLNMMKLYQSRGWVLLENKVEKKAPPKAKPAAKKAEAAAPKEEPKKKKTRKKKPKPKVEDDA